MTNTRDVLITILKLLLIIFGSWALVSYGVLLNIGAFYSEGPIVLLVTIPTTIFMILFIVMVVFAIFDPDK